MSERVALARDAECEKTSCMTLDGLAIGQSAQIAGISPDDPDLEVKLREIGFAEGDEVEALHPGPFGAKSLCVRLNRTIIALRRREASAIKLVALETQTATGTEPSGLGVAAE